MNFIIKRLKSFKRRYLLPFWFSSKCDTIKVPYFYGFCLQVALFFSVAMFLQMAIEKYDAAVLGSVAGVIATLAGLYFGVLKLFETSKQKKDGE